MASINPVEPEELSKLIDSAVQSGKKSSFKVRLWRAVGADLLEIISSDLYKDPRHVLRELVSNSYDEGANEVSVSVTGGCVEVKDNGRGMDLVRLSNIRRVAESEKVY